jgi:hypothetical protein
MPKIPSSIVRKSLAPGPYPTKRARSLRKPPPPPPIIQQVERLVRPPCRLGRCPMDIDSPPLPDRMEIDDPWSSNLITLDTNWVSDHMGGLVSPCSLLCGTDKVYFDKKLLTNLVLLIDAHRCPALNRARQYGR